MAPIPLVFVTGLYLFVLKEQFLSRRPWFRGHSMSLRVGLIALSLASWMLAWFSVLVRYGGAPSIVWVLVNQHLLPMFVCVAALLVQALLYARYRRT